MNPRPKLRDSVIARNSVVAAAPSAPPPQSAAPPPAQASVPPSSSSYSSSASISPAPSPLESSIPPIPPVQSISPPELDPDNPSQYPSRKKRDIPHNLSGEIKLQIVEYACERIAEGEMLRTICELENMPCPNTFRAWLRRDPELALLYHGSKEDRTEHYARLALEQAREPVPTYEDRADNIRLDPAAVSNKRIRVNATQRILNMLTVKERHASTAAAPAKPASDYPPHNQEKWDPEAGCEAMGRLQQSAINNYRQYHLDTFGEFITDDQGLEVVGRIIPAYRSNYRRHCSEPPEIRDPKPSNPGTPPPKPLA